MYEAYNKLSDEKKRKIIQASMEVFGEKGYTNASTNEIVKRAGISKGILFHYFGNKKNLYLFTLDYTINRAIEIFSSDSSIKSPDLFQRIMAMGMLKMKIASQEPLVFKLTFVTFINTPDEIRSEVQERYKKLYEMSFSMLYDGLDLSKMRKGIDPQKAIEILILFMEWLQKKYLEIYKGMDAEQAMSMFDFFMKDTMEYLHIIRDGIYE